MIELGNAVPDLTASNGIFSCNFNKDSDLTSNLQGISDEMRRGNTSISNTTVEGCVEAVMNAPASQRWKDVFIDYSQPIPPSPPALANIGGIGIVFRAGLTSISGPEKSGKTTLVRIILASVIAGKEIIGIKTDPDASIILFDTEQTIDRILRQIQGAFRLAGKSPSLIDNLKVVRLREYAPEDRFKRVIDIIGDLTPDIVIIDGITDLMNDPNDLEESGKKVSKLLAVSELSDCGIVELIHTNPGFPDGKLRGHIGSELMRKCEMNILMQRDKSGIFSVTCKSSRGRPFKSIFFKKDESDDITIVDRPEQQKAEKKKPAAERILAAMTPNVYYKYVELLSILNDKTPEGTVKSAITALKDSKRILLDEANGYSLPNSE